MDIKLPQHQNECADIARNLVIDSILDLARNLDDRLAEIGVNIDIPNTPEAISIMSSIFREIYHRLSEDMITERGRNEAQDHIQKL